MLKKLAIFLALAPWMALAQTNVNLNSTTPAAPSGFQNCVWQESVSGNNVQTSCYVPISTATAPIYNSGAPTQTCSSVVNVNVVAYDTSTSPAWTSYICTTGLSGYTWYKTGGGGGSGAVASVSNSDGTLAVSPTTGSVVASLNLAHTNSWSAVQTFLAGISVGSSTTPTLFQVTGQTVASLPAASLYPPVTTGSVTNYWETEVTDALNYTVPLTGGGSIVMWVWSNGSAWEPGSPFEPALSNPSVNGYVLSSTTAGVRSWIANGSGGSMSWPSTPGITVCTGTPCTAWGTSLTAPTGSLVGVGQANTYTTGLQDFSSATMKLPSSVTVGANSITLPASAGTVALTSQIPSVGTWGALNYPAWSSGTPFVKMTAAGAFALDTNTYLTSSGVAGMISGQLAIAGSGTTITSSIGYATATTSSTIVERDSSSNINAVTFTGNLSGNAMTATNLSSYSTLCTGSQFSQGLSSGSNNCATPSGSGNTTSTSLISTTIPVANGANSIVNSLLTDNGTTAAYSGTGGITASNGPVTASNGWFGSPSSAAKAALPSGAHGFTNDESSTAGVPATSVDYCRSDSTAHGYKCSLNDGAEFTSLMNFAGDGSTLTESGTTLSCTTATSSQIGCAKFGTGLTVTSGSVTPNFGTSSGTVAQGGVITAGGPTGSATSIPVITYNAAGQLTTVTTATPTVSAVNGVSFGASPSTNTVPVVTGTNATTYEALPLAAVATQAANTVLANVTGSTAAPTAATIPAGIQFYTLGTGYTAATSSNILGVCTTCVTTTAANAFTNSQTITSAAIGGVPLTIYGFSSGQTGDLFDVYLYNGGTKAFYVDKSENSNFNYNVYVTGTLNMTGLSYLNGGIYTNKNSGASSAAFTEAGTAYTGGSGTTTFPYNYYNCSGSTAVSTFNTAGTIWGINT